MFPYRSANWVCVCLSTSDIDECELFHNGQAGKLCLHACINTPGGYRCSCPVGYNATRDGRSCKGALTFFLFDIWYANTMPIKNFKMAHFLKFISHTVWLTYISVWISDVSLCRSFLSQTSTSVPPDKTTAQRTRCASTHMGVSSVSTWTAPKFLMLHMSRRRPCELCLLVFTLNSLSIVQIGWFFSSDAQ